ASSSFSSLESRCGTSTFTVTSRSPAPLLFGTPLPRTRNVRPLEVPAGIFKVTGPFNVGTCTLAPSAASEYVTGRSTVRSPPRRPKTGCGSTRTSTYRSPGAPPAGPASPLPRTRIRWPSFTPGGIRTENSRVRRTLPDPWQVWHGCSTIRPAPPHLGHVCANWKNPWSTATDPDPPHWGQVTGDVPGSAPEPPHVWHGAAPLIFTGTVV